MAEQSYERHVLDEIDQLRLFLGTPRSKSSMSDNTLAILIWIVAAGLGLLQIMMYSRTILFVLAAIVVRFVWMGLFSRSK